MGELVAIYARLIGSRMRSQLQYRVSFTAGVIGNGLISFLDFIAILVFFRHVPGIGGWGFEEIAFLYGSSYLGLRLADAFVGHIEQLPQYIRAGTFDLFLMRPLSSLFQVLTADFSLRQFGGFIQGGVVFGWAVASLPLEWSAPKVAMTALMVISGLVLFLGIWIATNSIAFWFIDTREVANAFTYGGNYVTQYPLHIFAGWLRRLFTFVIPVGFINYYPALYVLGRDGPVGDPALFPFISPLVATAFLTISMSIWNAGVKRYQSTGS